MPEPESSPRAAAVRFVSGLVVLAATVTLAGCRTGTASDQILEQRLSEIEQNISDLQNSVTVLQNQIAAVKPVLSRTESLEVDMKSIADPFAFGSMGWKVRDLDARLSTLELDVQTMKLRQH